MKRVQPTVLVSGASIAGPALAYWLRRHGFAPTVIERAPGPRPGGQAIDVRGVAREVIRRMGLWDAVAACATNMRGMSFVDGDGRELMRTTHETLTGGRLDSDDIELMRDDLSELLLRATADVPYRYDTSIAALERHADGVDVTFDDGRRERYDLVVGADGLHSNVRALAFGPEADFVRPLGIQLAVFTVPNTFGLDHWQIFYRLPDAMVGVYSARNNHEARAILGFAADQAFDHRDRDAQKRHLAERFANVGWRTAEIVDAMHVAPDFHCDMMAQVVMERWTRGRVALIGDAGYCGSPMSGQGTSAALVGAYVLAHELGRADYERAFTNYQTRMQPFVAKNQALALMDREAPPDPALLEEAANALDLDA